MRRDYVCIVLFSILFLYVTPTTGNVQVELSKLSKTAPYVKIPEQGAPNWYSIDLEFIQAGDFDRIRQDGTIYQIRFAVANASALAQFNFTIWRKNGKNYDRIATTDNLINNISNGINVINLSPPLEGIREGDYYGYRIKTISSGNPLHVDLNDENHLTYFTGEPASYINYNWKAQAFSNRIFVIEPYMVNPYMVFIGDSIIEGNITDIPTTIENHWGKKVNKSYQNMGYGTIRIINRFNSDVLDLSPEFLLIEGGVNDVNSNKGTSTILSNWESMIQKAYNNNITPVIMLILPWTKGSDTQLKNINYINNQLIIIAAKYSPSIVVDARCYVGVNRPSGPKGNCWIINQLYTSDGLHFNSAGNERIAKAIVDSFSFIHGKQGLYNLIQSDGTIIYSTNLSKAINTSWRMASTDGTANVSYNIPSREELANMTIHSGTIDWFNINKLPSDQIYYLFRSNGEQVDHNTSVNKSVIFTTDMSPGTYVVMIESTKPAAAIQSEEKIQIERKIPDFMTKLFIIIGALFVFGLIIEVYLRKKKI